MQTHRLLSTYVSLSLSCSFRSLFLSLVQVSMESSRSTQLGFFSHGHEELAKDIDEEKQINNRKVGMAAMDSSCMSTSGSCAVVEPNFHVDDLLNFPSELEDELLGDASPATVPLHDSAAHVKLDGSSSVVDDTSYGLCIPSDELVYQLEWLSSFNEDYCFLGGDAKRPSSASSSSRTSSGLARCIKEAPMTTSRKPRESFNSQSPVSVLEQGTRSYMRPCGINHVYKSQRVRKARTGGRVWSLDILKPIRVANRIKNSYESTSLLVTSNSSVYPEPLCSFLTHDVLERPLKKMKQASTDTDPGLVRRCTHCLVQKTPQWRAGPQGPKTLCNACGVRYKSGRLVPEYRPAASPSFVNEVHSNSHRRILEMRRAKEVELHVEIDGNKMEREEETSGSENGQWSYVSVQASCEERMDMQACKGLHSHDEGREVLPCEQVEISGDDRLCTDHGIDQGAPRKAHGSWGDGTTGTDDVIDSFTSKSESVLVNASASAYNIEAMSGGKLMHERVGIHEQGNIICSAKDEPGKQCDSLQLET